MTSDNFTTPISTDTASVTVGPGFTIAKSESSATLNPGQNITYTLAYSHSGQSLQLFDSYDNDSVAPPPPANGIQGFDGTLYTGSAGVSFTVASDSQNNHYIIAQACPGLAIGVTCNTFGTLLRNGPTVNICTGYTVEGNMYIPVGDQQGSDAHMVIAASGTNAYMVGISLDNFPGNFFLQKNNAGTVANPVTLLNNQIATTITAGVWYTVESPNHLCRGFSKCLRESLADRRRCSRGLGLLLDADNTSPFLVDNTKSDGKPTDRPILIITPI